MTDFIGTHPDGSVSTGRCPRCESTWSMHNLLGCISAEDDRDDDDDEDEDDSDGGEAS